MINRHLKNLLSYSRFRRVISATVAISIAVSVPAPLTWAEPAKVPYQVQVEHFLSNLKPASIWDRPANNQPGEITERWANAIREHQDQMFSNHVSDIQRAENFDLWIENLRQNAFFGASANPALAYYSNHPLDVFGVLGQTVHTKPVETKRSKIKRVLQPVIQAKRTFGRAFTEALSSFGQVTASLLIGDSAISASVDEAREVPPGFEPEIRREPYFAALNWDRLVVDVVDQTSGEIIRRFNPNGADLTGLYPGNGAKAGETNFDSLKTRARGPFRFQLSYQGQVLNDFQNNVISMAVFDRYLVFLEPGHTHREKGIVNLSFIDLAFFESAVGRTVLPIFRLPIKVSDAAMADVDHMQLEATAKGLKVDGSFVNSEVFGFFSWMQQMAFNTTVSLTDEKFYDSTSKVLNSLIEHFDTALDQSAQDLGGQLERAGISMDLYKEFRTDLQRQLKVRAEIGVATQTPRELERAHGRLAHQAVKQFDAEVGLTTESDKTLEMLSEARIARAKSEADAISRDVKGHLQKAERFGQQLAADRAFQESLQSYGQAISSTRKLTNRVSAFFARMVKPQPLGAPKIQQALGLIAAGVTSKDAWKTGGGQVCAYSKEGLLELVANRKSRVALEVLTGAALCTLYPAETAQFAFQAVDVGRTMMTGFLGWLDNWAIISKTAWEASWSWLDAHLLYETYVDHGRFKMLATGVGAMFGSLLAAAGTAHTIVNGYHYAKAVRSSGDWQRNRADGIGFFKNFKQTFVNYMKTDRSNWYAALSRAEKRRRGQDLVLSLPDGTDFKGLFRSSQANDFNALTESQRNSQPFEITITLSDGSTLRGEALVAPRSSDLMFIEMELPDGSKVARVIRPIDGDWSQIGDDELMSSGAVCEMKLKKSSIAGVLQSTEWTQDEEQMLSQLLEDLRRKDSAMAQRFAKMQSVPLIGSMFKTGKGDIETLGRAIRHFIVGYSSWTHTTKLFGKIWNPWFLLRNFWVRPRSWFTMMAYPNLFNRMVWNNGVATYFDGGKRSLNDMFWVRRLVKDAGFDDSITNLDAIEKFEKDVIPVEQAIHKAATRQAFLHLVQVAAHDPDVIALLSQGGKAHPYDGKFKSLDKRLRIYLEAYFNKSFEDSLRTHLLSRMGMDTASALPDGVIKESASAYQGSFALTDAEADTLVKRVAIENGVATYAKRVSEGEAGTRLERLRLAHWRKVGVAMDAQYNGSLRRYKLAETQMNNEEAMARATRQYMVGLVVDKPIELLFTFLFLAGIDEGVLKPLHDEAFGPDSAFHLSRYVFWNGYYVGIMISLLADVWMKVQMDARVDGLGGFGNVPTPEEYKKGFISYYKKNFAAPDNRWWDNQKMEMTLSFINMPAYFVTAMVTNLAALGRFDLDSFMSVYKGSLLPTGGLGYKLENSFEMSANYVVGAIPSKFHSDPRVQEFRNDRIGRLRLAYNFLYKTFYENPLGNLIGNWMTIPVSGIGPRAWMRQFYGGYLPTEVIANNVLRPAAALNMPILSGLANSCDVLLTNNHTDAVKLIPKPGR